MADPEAPIPAQPSGTPAPSDLGRGHNAFPWRFVTPLYLGSALNPVNSSLIATALVPIAHAINVPVGQTAVLVSALYLASAIAQPTSGKLAEVFGPRRMFLAGIALVLTGGVLGGVGSDLATLVVARILIGIGTSAGYPSAMLMIRRRADAAGLAEPPGGVLGGLQIAGAVTAVVGLPIGGVLVDALGWRTTFLINLPTTVIAFAMAACWLPRDIRADVPKRPRDIAARVDALGIAGFAGAMAALLVFLMSLPHTDWWALGVAIVLGSALVGWELRAGNPFIDFRLLATNLALTRTYLRLALTTLCIYAVLYGLTQWLEAGRGISSMTSGLLLLPMTGLSAIVVRPLAQRNLVRGPLIVAAVSCLGGSAGILLLNGGTPVIAVIAITLVFGITLGTTSIGNQTALYTQVTAAQLGTAAGLLRTAAYLGSIGSSAIIGIVFHENVTDHGLHIVGVIMIAVSALAVVVTVLDRRLRSRGRVASEID
ncbi:MFS transporter [Amycolatopsis taiwanensis]|uniref:MFS transporter n=1 Tax=Amycolatopsis taiwanensis TaxID=342230 RepID=A0A9W6VFN7_9PSEU|nr:MFS transporter [Amycolatopsis taiwanensis]GLY65064.1 MFS transporter [Amycolatopsis taiwanensis]